MPPSGSHSSAPSRWRWHIQGQVQGVGFRPFVYRAARAAGVTGRVFNDARGVQLEIQGDAPALAAFAAAFDRDLPAPAHILSCRRIEVPVVAGEREFVIAASDAGTRHEDQEARSQGDTGPDRTVDAAVAVDTAVCAECLREMRAPNNRRYHHALINCTNCGPRFSIIRDVPYDRAGTTMAGFAMCPACRGEYGDPGDRRFHAQPVCCPKCGPRVELVRVFRGRARRIPGNPFDKAAQLLLAGKIVALKGLGGFHLAVRADRAESVAGLRTLKQRDAKPFALMCRDITMARALVALSPEAQAELTGVRAPIVLARRRGVREDKETRRQGDTETRRHGDKETGTSSLSVSPGLLVSWSVAPGTDLLGVMLPYTPVHHLLWDALGRWARGDGEPPPLVMTSGNVANEPLVIDNADALARLGPLCTALLWHDRPIERCVDDSVVLDRGPGRAVLPIRRSRGYAPSAWTGPARGADAPVGSSAPSSSDAPVGHPTPGAASPFPLPPSPSGICLGGELKNTIAVVRRGQIIASQHLGDLTDARAYAHFRQAIEDLLRLFHVNVEFIAHDLHPGYMSTVAARELGVRFGARLVPVQHHVAHAYGVMGEHGLDRALALVCDGTGYGTDGTIWGGELLAIDGARWARMGRLKPMRLPGGDAAARDPKRSALALLHGAYGAGFEEMPEAAALFARPADRRMLARMLATGLSSPWTSSTGRLFDGIAALLGLGLRNDHEAQAAMALEAAAWSAEAAAMPGERLFEVRRGDGGGEAGGGLWELDFSPLVRWIVEQRRQGGKNGREDEGASAGMARVFQRALAQGWVGLTSAAGGDGEGSRGVLVGSGGSMCNRMLERDVGELGSAAGYRTFFHNMYPPTDAGLAFGQAQYVRVVGLTRAMESDKRE